MTPQERQLVTNLFDRLASLESEARDADAERLIGDGARRAPHAVYALVQTVLVQDEALRRADARIKALEGGDAPQPSGSFLDSMRDALLGRDPRPQGSVPQGSVPQGSVPQVRSSAVWNSQPSNAGQPQQPLQNSAYAQPTVGQGGSFLGTAAAAAAGMIGGSLLMGSFRTMFGGAHTAQGAVDPGAGAASPWADSNASGSDLARDAGLNDIGHQTAGDNGADRQGLLGGVFGGSDADRGDFSNAEDTYADDSDGGFDDSADV